MLMRGNLSVFLEDWAPKSLFLSFAPMEKGEEKKTKKKIKKQDKTKREEK